MQETDGDQHRKAPLWLLALMTFTGTLAMHIFVPALPIAGADLGGDPSTMQMTISLYILGLAVGQLIYGPLSDRFGRRPILIAGLVIYTFSGLAAALAPNVNSLIVTRLFQAFGGCAGLVIGRALVRDTSSGDEATRRMALMSLMVTVGPGIAPILGGVLAGTIGWRSIFWLLAALGVVNLVLSWKLLQEPARPIAASGAAVARNYWRLLKSPIFRGYAIGGSCATTSMYGYIAAAPFIFTEELRRPAEEAGAYLAIIFLGIWTGSMLASYLVSRHSPRSLLLYGNGLSVLFAFTFLGIDIANLLSVPLILVAMFMFTFGMGIASPAAMTKAISVDASVAGSASGLYGFIQMVVGAICATLVGIGPSPALAAGIVLSVAGIISQIAFWSADRAERRS